MKKVKRGKILLKDIVFWDNSRVRTAEDVADLMEDITTRGLMQPIGINAENNKIIYGNRRAIACEKLGYTEIEADFYEDVSEIDMLTMNVAENIKRKNIGGIELGRICSKLSEMGLSCGEIASKLSVRQGRVASALGSYSFAKDSKFAPYLSLDSRGRERNGIPITTVWKLQQSLMFFRQVTKNEADVLLKEILDGNITNTNAGHLVTIWKANPEWNVQKVLSVMKNTSTAYVTLIFDGVELSKALIKSKTETAQQFVKKLVLEHNEKLLH